MRFLLVFCLAGLAVARSAAPAPAATALPPPTAWALVLRDMPATATIAEVAALPDSRFRPYSPTEPFAAGQRHAGQPPVWLRLTLPSGGPVALPAFLEIGAGYEDDVDLFQPDGRGGWRTLRAGERTGPADRAWPALRNVLPVVLPPAGAPPEVIHVRVAEVFGPLWIVRLHADGAAFARRETVEIAQNFAYFGCLVALVVYNLFLYLRLGYRDLLFYLLYVLTFGAVMLYGTNTNALLFPTEPGRRELIVLALLNASTASLLLFVREYHELATRSRWLSRLTLGAAIVFLLGLAQLGSTPLSRAGTYAYFFNLLLCLAAFVFVPIVSLLAWRRGATQARFFLVAFSFLLVGLVVMLAGYLGFFLLAHSYQIALIRTGSALEMILLALAIGDRFRRLRDAQAALQAQYTVRLESDVAARTSELALANTQKDRLFSVIGHDLRGPLGAISLNAAQLARTGDRPTAETAVDIQASARSATSLLDNLLDWSRVLTGTARLHPEAFALGPLESELRDLLEPVARQRGLRLEVDLASAGSASTDRAMLATILRNLAHNALKVARTRVALSARRQPDGSLAFSVADDGPGIPPERLAALGLAPDRAPSSDPAVRGLGLIVCREFATLLQGRLWADSDSTGTTLQLHLPAAPAC